MNIYFSGIGGVGIGPLAEIAFDAGYQVQGSDTNESRMTQRLKERGLQIAMNQDGSFFQAVHNETSVDWFVHTSALPASHPELLLARELGIKTAKRDELIAHIIAEKNLKLIAVAGSHGKTTTTGMLIWTMQQLHTPISYSVGTTLQFGPSGKYDPSSEYFIYECDEFDRNFLHFNPYLSLITSIDYDHPDTYLSEKEYYYAFSQFGSQSQRLIAWKDQYADLFTKHPNAWILDPSEVIDAALPGEHNRRNATLVVKALENLGIGGDVSSAINAFPGTDRRFEKLADNLYSDYGHHPAEIAATLQMAREVSDHVTLIYQPHQNVRQYEIKDQYTNQFELADEVYWLPTYLSREDPNLAILTSDDLTKNITNKDTLHTAELDGSLWNVINTNLTKGNLVLCMGAGSIDSWLRDRLAS
jgi:UDP-N-acetylmuramate--alanine ligase